MFEMQHVAFCFGRIDMLFYKGGDVAISTSDAVSTTCCDCIIGWEVSIHKLLATWRISLVAFNHGH